MVDAWFFWVSPEGRIVAPRYIGSGFEWETHADILDRLNLSERDAYSRGWVRVSFSGIEGEPWAIERNKETILIETGYPSSITIDFHIGGRIVAIETTSDELLETDAERLAKSALAARVRTFRRPRSVRKPIIVRRHRRRR